MARSRWKSKRSRHTARKARTVRSRSGRKARSGGRRKGVTPPWLRPYLFRKGHKPVGRRSRKGKSKKARSSRRSGARRTRRGARKDTRTHGARYSLDAINSLMTKGNPRRRGRGRSRRSRR